MAKGQCRLVSPSWRRPPPGPRGRPRTLLALWAVCHAATALAADPDHKQTLETMRSRMTAKMKELEDTFEKCTWYRDHWTDGDRNIIASARGKF